MNKRMIFWLRIIVYTIAVYALYDMFFTDKSENTQKKAIQLESFKYKSGQLYYEFFLKLDENDSTWNELQIQPNLGLAKKIGKDSPWSRSSDIWEHYLERGFLLKGFYLTTDIKLNAYSFFQITDRMKKLKSHSNKHLSSLHPNKDLTIILVKK